jgi:hypothetical protein
MSLPARQQRVITAIDSALLPVMIMMIILGVLAAAIARFLRRTVSEQALSPSPATSETSGVC